MPPTPKTQPARRAAFTLIELLLVVSIIAILSSIAVYNLSEAQTRAKASRAKADMRTIATALESYAVDNNDYPPNAGVPTDGALATLAAPGSTLGFTPPQITTPIAYLTSLPEDPFKFAAGDVYGVGAVGALESRGYDYYRIITPPEWWTWADGSATGIATLIPFVAVHVEGSVGVRNGVTLFGNVGAFEKYGHWVQWSIGPDKRPWDWEKDFSIPGDLTSPLKTPPYDEKYFSFDVPYDPTNGVISFGNIHRTQSGRSELAFNADGTAGTGTDQTGGGPAAGGPTAGGRGNAGSGGGSGSDAGGGAGRKAGSGGSGSAGGGPGGRGPGEPPGGGRRPWGGSTSRGTAQTPPMPGASATKPGEAREVDITTPEGMLRMIEKYPGSRQGRTFKSRLRMMDMRELSLALLVLGLILLFFYVLYRMLHRPVDAIENFDASHMDDENLAYLVGLGPVKALHLAESRVTDAGLAHVGSMDSLQSVNLWGADVGDAGVAHLRSLPNLRELILGRTNVTDEGLKSLLKLRKLEMLALAGTPITDRSVQTLRQMKSLRILNLRGTRLSADAVRQISLALPSCQIQVGEIDAEPGSAPPLAGG